MVLTLHWYNEKIQNFGDLFRAQKFYWPLSVSVLRGSPLLPAECYSSFEGMNTLSCVDVMPSFTPNGIK